MYRPLILLIIILFSINTVAYNKVIYGTDDRVDYYREQDLLKQELSESVATLVPRSALQKIKGGYLIKSLIQLKSIEIQSDKYLCKNEKLYNQQVLGIL